MALAVVMLLSAVARADDPPKPPGELSPALRQAADGIAIETTVTCLGGKDGETYLPAVRELLDRLGRYKQGKLAFAVAATPEQRQAALGAFRESLLEGPPGYAAVAKDFKALAEARIAGCTEMAKQWSDLPADSWLGCLGLARAVPAALTADAESYRRAVAGLPSKDKGIPERDAPRFGDPDVALPDHAAMVRQIDAALRNDVETLRQIDQVLRQVAAARDAAVKVRETLPARTGAVSEAVVKMIAAVGKPDDPVPADPTATLKEFVANCRAVAGAANDAAKAVTDFDEASGGWASRHRRWVIQTVSLPVVYQLLVERACELADQTEQVADDLNADGKKKVLIRARQLAPRLLETAKALSEASAGVAAGLGSVDKASAEVVAAGAQRKVLDPIARITPVLAACRTLPRAPDVRRLSERLEGPCALLVRAGKQVRTVSFEELFPPAADGARLFDGEAALAKVLRWASGKPVGRVVLAYYEVIPPAGQVGAVQPVIGPIYSGQLMEMRAALERAGLNVVDWNMAAKVDPPIAPPGREGLGAGALPQTLLVLPPPAPAGALDESGQKTPGWTALHTDSLAAAVRKCGSAVFCVGYASGYSGGTSPEYPLGDYLRRQWGLNPRTNLRLVRATPADDAEGTFRLGVVDWVFLPLASFTDHGAVRTVKGRRALWMDACPVVATSEPVAGVTVESILTVPRGDSGCWATADAAALVDRLRSSAGEVTAAIGAGDLKPPFPVVVSARKGSGKDTVRIVVMGAGPSISDVFCLSPVPRVGADGTVRNDPPPAAAMALMVNCLYHILGKDELIGPAPRKVPSARPGRTGRGDAPPNPRSN